MAFITILGFAAAILTTVCNIPQAIKIIRTRSVKDISAFTYSLLFVGLTLWTVYGILKTDWPLILANGISSAITGAILVMKITIKKQDSNTGEQEEGNQDDFPV